LCRNGGGASLARVSRTINGPLGEYTDPSFAGSSWLWEIERDGAPRRVAVLILALAKESERGVPSDTARAIQRKGESEVKRVAALDDPPHVVKCGTDGCVGA
jgi:hypothetical protein